MSPMPRPTPPAWPIDGLLLLVAGLLLAGLARLFRRDASVPSTPDEPCPSHPPREPFL